MVSSDPGAQNMVALKVRGIPTGPMTFRPVSKMVLTSNQPQEFILQTYCLDFHKANPSESTTFSVGAACSPEVLQMLEALDKVPASKRSIGAIQAAIWAVTENVSREELLARFPVTAEDIESARAILQAAGIDPLSRRLFAP